MHRFFQSHVSKSHNAWLLYYSTNETNTDRDHTTYLNPHIIKNIQQMLPKTD